MKAAFIFSAGLLLPACASAQIQQKEATVRSGQHQKTVSYQNRGIDSTGKGRTSTASWHYHSGPKRPQVKIDETSPERAEDRNPDATEKSDSTRK